MQLHEPLFSLPLLSKLFCAKLKQKKLIRKVSSSFPQPPPSPNMTRQPNQSMSKSRAPTITKHHEFGIFHLCILIINYEFWFLIFYSRLKTFHAYFLCIFARLGSWLRRRHSFFLWFDFSVFIHICISLNFYGV